MKREFIPKDVLLCDICNDQVVNEEGEVIRDFVWTDYGLICSERFEQIDDGEFAVIDEFKEGDRIPRSHQLFRPMEIISF